MPERPGRRDQFLLCRACGRLTPLSLPGFDPAHDEDAAELAAFRAAHEAHGIILAERSGDRAAVDRPVWDPMATRWFTVATAGSELLAVRSWRPHAEGPRHYELVQGGPPPLTVWVDVDEPLLRRALDRHFYPHVISDAQLDAMIAAVRTILAPLDPEAVDIAFDDAALPDTGIGALPEPCAARLLDVCRTLFDPVSFERADSFVREHAGPDGALAVRVHRALTSRAA